MNLTQINEAFKAGTLKLNPRSHALNELRDDTFQSRLDFLKKSLKKHDEEEGYVKMLNAMLEQDIEFGEIIPESREIYCFNCGEHFSLVLMNETTLV